MIAEKIQNIINQEKRNIVFYFDADGSQLEELPGIEALGIRVVVVQKNYFELKYQLEFEWQNQPVFLYHPFAKPSEKELRKYPLLDLLTANTELSLDKASGFLAEYHLPDYHLPLVKHYLKQLNAKTFQKKLAPILDPSRFDKDNLIRGFISITLDFQTVVDKNSCMAKWLSLASDEKALTRIARTLKELEADADLLNWFYLLTNIKGSELNRDYASEIACKLKYNILTAYIDKPAKSDSYSKLKIERTSDLNRVQVFFQDWNNHPTLKDFVEPVFSQLAEDINSSNILEWYGPLQEYGYYSDDMVRVILSNLYNELETNPVKTKDDCIKWQRSPALSNDFQNQISLIYHIAYVYSILDSYKSFRFNKAEDFIREYTGELYKVDYNFRKGVIAFDKVRDHLYEFEEVASAQFATLNQKYDRFLIELNVEWQKILSEINFNYRQIEVDKQYDFYQKNLHKFEFKMVVIISDALRYELGYEIYNDLLVESKNNLSIDHCLASIPSYTNLGMANLLPNSGISVETAEPDLNFKIQEKSTVSTNRSAILQMTTPESTAIDFSFFKKMIKEERRAFFKNYKVIYLYHDWIDAIGDKKRTEHETFEASSKAVEDIKWMIKNISGELGIAHVMVTSDHGFLYNYTDLPESSRESLPKTVGYAKEHVRYVVAEEFEGKVDGYLMNMKDTTNINTTLKVAVPRAINRFRKQGNIGVQFVHGGSSLQELITPVIKFYKNKKESQQSVTFKRIDQTQFITTGSIKITLLQDQPVSNDFKSAEILFGLYNDIGELFSNEQEIQLTSTSNNPKERIFEVILTLNSSGSKAGFCYLKAFDKKDKGRLNPLGINDLLKISSLMEKDEF